MTVKNIGQKVMQKTRGMFTRKNAAKKTITDGFKKGEKMEKLDADKLKALKNGITKKSADRISNNIMLGLGVWAVGMTASAAAIPAFGVYGVGLLFASAFGGAAIMTRDF